jgi:acylphosphatase
VTVQRRVLVSGQVQGVFFRASCEKEATSRDVAGWARNNPDGRVEVCLEGAEDAVNEVIEWCKHGPPWAEVAGVEIIEEEPTGQTSFRIR